MKIFKTIKILFLLLLMVSFTPQTTKATTVDDAPVYLNDGQEGLCRDLYCNLSNALVSHSDSIKGKCFFTFVISKEGAIDIETIKLVRKTSLPDECVNAAEEAIMRLGKFRPGKRLNFKEKKWEPIRASYNIVVIFPIPSKYLTSE